MSTTIWVLIVILALILGFVGGFFAARKYMENYLKKNPPINESMLKVMMLQMGGQKPSEKKLHQMMTAMKAQGKKK
nr:YneF family protein [Liquorilactobacillus satsumensis]